MIRIKMRNAPPGCSFLALVLWLVSIIGWIKCIIHFIQCDFDPVGKAEILYGIGTFTGLGALIGWFNFGH